MPQESIARSVGVATGSSTPSPQDLKPLIVGRRHGFGQVTLVGIDLSDPTVLKSIDAFSLHKIWTRIFNWRGSKIGQLLPPSEFENQQTEHGTTIVKLFFHVDAVTQAARLHARGEDPWARHLMTQHDLRSLSARNAYLAAWTDAFAQTDTRYAHWSSLRRRARQLHAFGLTIPEISRALQIGHATAHRAIHDKEAAS